MIIILPRARRWSGACNTPSWWDERRLAMESEKRHFRMDRKQIGLLRFILEAYEGIATLTTIDPAAGRVVLLVPPGCEAEVDHLLADLASDIYLEPENAAMG